VATTTTLNSMSTRRRVGQGVARAATVEPASGDGVPTGTVTFRDGATAIGSPVALVNGSASMVVSTLAAGSHSLTAAYGGSLDFLASTSAAVTQVVNKLATTTTLNSTPNPSTVGEAVKIGRASRREGGARGAAAA